MTLQEVSARVILPFLVSLMLCRVLISFGPGDAPDGVRKMQAVTVPSAGGLGILAGMFLPFLTDMSLFQPGGGLAIPAAMILVCAVIGLVDDITGLPASLKLVCLAALCLLAAAYAPRITHFWLPWAGGAGLALPAWAAVAGVAAWFFVMINATNFMDGANGVAMGSALIMLAACCILLAEPDMGAAGQLLLAAVSAITGFLVWNLTGRLYAGDTGALAIGGLIGSAGLLVSMRYPFWIAGLIVLPFLVDVLMTLLWRGLKGRALMSAHRDHAYQRLLSSGWGHHQVALMWWSLSALCAGLSLITASAAPERAAWVFLGATIAGCTLWILHRFSPAGTPPGAG